MEMGIDKAGGNGAPTQVDGFPIRRQQGAHLRVTTYRHDPIPIQRDGLGLGLACVHRVNLTIVQNQRCLHD